MFSFLFVCVVKGDVVVSIVIEDAVEHRCVRFHDVRRYMSNCAIDDRCH